MVLCYAGIKNIQIIKEVTQMNEIIKSIEDAQLKDNVTEFRVGDTIKVYAKVKEGNRERLQVFEGTVLKKQGGSNRATFTVRKNSNGIGVERTWPLHSPNIDKIEVVRRGKVRRAKLNYLRGRVGKKAKVKELVK
jgi:large subunit ribosomal protein L19